jgi:hypothetical protein
MAITGFTDVPECGVSLQGQERGQARAARQGVLVQALPEASFTGENASTSEKALIIFAWL